MELGSSLLFSFDFVGSVPISFFSFYVSFLFCFLVPLGFGGLWVLLGDKPTFNYWDKKTSFECGFDSLSNSWAPFSLRFYVLALLFMVVDVEIILFFCLIFSKGVLGASFSFFLKFWLCFFLCLLGVALVHEDNEGSLEWK
uniref:NADH dehydrogenase subunit 3 n=1 Tax=Xylophaga oregona TaxID=2584329 RepID=UPI0020287865|nr:NADH dehydrogenase subunit 3 [Xylophaga oregona]UPX88892.1 NADH dehydrogenase subunit 3 [Xylophaga oregona]